MLNLKNLNVFITLIFFISSLGLFLTAGDYGAHGTALLTEGYLTIIDRNKFGDEAGFLRVAEVWSREGIKLENSGILGLWPPGLMFTHYIGFLIFGDGYAPVLFIGIINIIIMSVALAFLLKSWSLLGEVKFYEKLILVSSAIFSGYIWYTFIITRAPLLTEGLSIVLFSLYLALTFCFFLTRTQFNERKFLHLDSQILILSSVLFLTIFTRQTYSMFIDIFLCFSILIALSFWRMGIRRLAKYASFYKILLFPALIVFIVSIPYKLFMFDRSGSFNIVDTNSYVWGQRWIPSEHLISTGGAWLVEGGANVPCLLNKPLCEKIYQREMAKKYPYMDRQNFREFKSLTFQTILTKPLDWASIKFSLFFKYWFNDLADVWKERSFNAMFVIQLCLLVFLGCISSLKLFFGTVQNKIISALILSVLVALTLPQFLLHFEVRYFLPIKYFTPFLYFSFLISNRHLHE
jgi:hypothetical protein